MKHGAGSIRAWACFAASRPGQHAIINRAMNYELYQEILQENVRLCLRTESEENVCHVILPKWMFCKVLNPIQMLWKALSKQFIEEKTHTSQSRSDPALKLLHVIVQDWSAFTRNFTFSYCRYHSHTFPTHGYETLDHISQERSDKENICVLFVYFQDLYENLMMFWVIFMQI